MQELWRQQQAAHAQLILQLMLAGKSAPWSFFDVCHAAPGYYTRRQWQERLDRLRREETLLQVHLENVTLACREPLTEAPAPRMRHRTGARGQKLKGMEAVPLRKSWPEADLAVTKAQQELEKYQEKWSQLQQFLADERYPLLHEKFSFEVKNHESHLKNLQRYLEEARQDERVLAWRLQREGTAAAQQKLEEKRQQMREQEALLQRDYAWGQSWPGAKAEGAPAPQEVTLP